MAPETQYRVNPTGANMREEPSPPAPSLTVFKPGTIVHMDHTDGDWLFVSVEGWMHKSTVTALEGDK